MDDKISKEFEAIGRIPPTIFFYFFFCKALLVYMLRRYLLIDFDLMDYAQRRNSIIHYTYPTFRISHIPLEFTIFIHIIHTLNGVFSGP